MKDELTYLEIKPTGSILFTSEEKDVLFQHITKLQVENDKLRDLMYERAHRYALHHMTEDELRIVATNLMEDNTELQELIIDLVKECKHNHFKLPSRLINRIKELEIEME